ncbi:MAG: TlpA family protein disulfide reductase, partial [Candidatus Omnitrophica bacterium]|nr:TlpA family protein disulfide reductase [Candidatus Omnitrophota bacterium]
RYLLNIYPEFALETSSGRRETMSLLRSGQPAMIFFWATWCPHCRSQLTELTQQREDIEEKGIKVILVDVGEDAQKVKAYFNANNISLDTFLDQDGVVANDYKVIGVPTFFFVDTEGTVVAAEHSLISDYEEILLGSAL